MKRIAKKLILVMACFIAGLCFCFTLVVASAETASEEPANSNEIITDEEISNENHTNETVEETPETNFEDFLAWAQNEANRYGYGNEFEQAVDSLRVAATQKQVTLSTIASVVLFVAVIGLIISHRIKDKHLKDAIIALAKNLDGKLDDSIKGTNALIDGENSLLDGETVLEKNTAKTTKELGSIKRCLRAFVAGFLRFTDGIKIGDNKKTEVQTNCLNALKELDDGEGGTDEDNKE